MKRKLLIFGTGKISEAVSYFFNRDSDYYISAYICDDAFINNDTFKERPVVGMSKVAEQYPASEFVVFVAVGYQNLNQLRAKKVEELKSLGYSFAKYQSPYVLGSYELGDNSIIMDSALIQPCARFGNNVFVWGGAMIGHHAVIEDNCWLTGGCQIGGLSKIGMNTFVGLGAIVGHEVNIGNKCMLGAGVLTTKSVADGVVLVSPNTEPHRLNSDQFIRMSTCFRT